MQLIETIFDVIIFNGRPCLHPALRGSLRSFDRHRQYPADLAGYYSRCPSGKSKTIRFISALFI
jgi:hypothetical protein